LPQRSSPSPRGDRIGLRFAAVAHDPATLRDYQTMAAQRRKADAARSCFLWLGGAQASIAGRKTRHFFNACSTVEAPYRALSRLSEANGTRQTQAGDEYTDG